MPRAVSDTRSSSAHAAANGSLISEARFDELIPGEYVLCVTPRGTAQGNPKCRNVTVGALPGEQELILD